MSNSISPNEDELKKILQKAKGYRVTAKNIAKEFGITEIVLCKLHSENSRSREALSEADKNLKKKIITFIDDKLNKMDEEKKQDEGNPTPSQILTKYPIPTPQKIHNKLELYINQKFYIYFLEIIKKDKQPYLTRAVLRINDKYEVEIENISENNSNSYSGTVNLLTDKILTFSLKSSITAEKKLEMLVHIGTEKVYPYGNGAYLNATNEGTIVVASILLEHKNNEEEILCPKILYPNTEEYKITDNNVKRYFADKSKNYIKTNKGGILSDDDFAQFFAEQDKKSFYKKTITNQVFISFPMSKNRDFQEMNAKIKEISLYLEDKLKYNVDYVSKDMETSDDFLQRHIIYSTVKKHISKASKHLFIYNGTHTLNCFVEIGMAITHGNACTILCQDREELPTILASAENKRLTIIEYPSLDKLVSTIKKAGNKLFMEDYD